MSYYSSRRLTSRQEKVIFGFKVFLGAAYIIFSINIIQCMRLSSDYEKEFRAFQKEWHTAETARMDYIVALWEGRAVMTDKAGLGALTEQELSLLATCRRLLFEIASHWAIIEEWRLSGHYIRAFSEHADRYGKAQLVVQQIVRCGLLPQVPTLYNIAEVLNIVPAVTTVKLNSGLM
ncbi:hypothetical protein JW905_09300, partial [bacterium]|nr:hypothetical protein [candidate division CSSED10-310 bacterium]